MFDCALLSVRCDVEYMSLVDRTDLSEHLVDDRAQTYRARTISSASFVMALVQGKSVTTKALHHGRYGHDQFEHILSPARSRTLSSTEPHSTS